MESEFYSGNLLGAVTSPPVGQFGGPGPTASMLKLMTPLDRLVLTWWCSHPKFISFINKMVAAIWSARAKQKPEGDIRPPVLPPSSVVETLGFSGHDRGGGGEGVVPELGFTVRLPPPRPTGHRDRRIRSHGGDEALCPEEERRRAQGEVGGDGLDGFVPCVLRLPDVEDPSLAEWPQRTQGPSPAPIRLVLPPLFLFCLLIFLTSFTVIFWIS